MSYPANTADSDYVVSSSAQFDIKKFIFKIIGYLPWVIICLFLAIFISNLYLRYTPQYYRIAAFILVKDEESNSNYQILKEYNIIPGNKDVDNEIDILLSHTLMARVVDSLQLNISISKEGRVIASELFGKTQPVYYKLISENPDGKPAIFKLEVGRNTFVLTSIDGGRRTYYYGDTVNLDYGKFVFDRNSAVKLEPNGFQFRIKSKDEAANILQGQIEVQRKRENSGIIEVAKLDLIPERGEVIVNELIEVYNTASLVDKNIAASKTVEFLKSEIVGLNDGWGYGLKVVFAVFTKMCEYVRKMGFVWIVHV